MHAGEPERVDVLIIGAGLSGVGAACHLMISCPWASYAVLESRDAIGGTWDLFRYPGVRSDSDMHTLGYSFRPWTGRKTIADGASILQYIRDTAAEYCVDETIRFHHRVVDADWSTADARWYVTAERTDTNERVRLSCSFLVSATGYYAYDHGYEPEFPGRDRFRGPIVHPQFWPEDLDVAGKHVVVVGSGATAVTLVPALAERGAHVTMLQRSPTYIMSMASESGVADKIRKVVGKKYAGRATRWSLALTIQGFYELSRRRPEIVKRAVRKELERRLPEGFDIDTHFTPTYDPWDERFCLVPDGDLFEAITDGKVAIVTDHIESFTEHGIALQSGSSVAADIIVTATGLDLLFIGGMQLTVDGEAVDLPERLMYRGMMVERVPNFASTFGYTNASWTLKSDLTANYVCRLLNDMRTTGMRQATPLNRDAAVDTKPMLGLTSGYVMRAVDRFPKSGSKFPWQVHQNYVRDYQAMKLRSVHDDVMHFSNPGPDAGRLDRFAGRVAAITGAGSGIGRALAEELSRRGSHLALCDVDEAALAETVARCEGAGVKVTSQLVDVADRAAIEAWAEQVVADHGRVNFVFNNAGVALGATIANMTYDDFEWLMNINFWGVVYGTKAFLPHLKQNGDGHVVNMSSVFGLVSVPSQSAYNAAKFGVRGFTDALRVELEIEPCGVSSTTVHPGGIRTNIIRNGRIRDNISMIATDPAQLAEQFDKMARTTPETAARKILAAVAANKRRVVIGLDGHFVDLLSRLPAGLYQRMFARAGRRR